jgi:hypothetical protein
VQDIAGQNRLQPAQVVDSDADDLAALEEARQDHEPHRH